MRALRDAPLEEALPPALGHHPVAGGGDALNVRVLELTPTPCYQLLNWPDEDYNDSDVVTRASVLGSCGKPGPDVVNIPAINPVLLQVLEDNLSGLLGRDGVPQPVTGDDEEVLCPVLNEGGDVGLG